MEHYIENALIDVIRKQESTLIFPHFCNEDAYQIGTLIKQTAEKRKKSIVVSIFCGNEQLFYHAMQAIKPINLSWLQRKIRTTNMYRCSSYLVGLQQICNGSTFTDAGLDPTKFAGVGGCFPVVLKGRGYIGTIAVSGMQQQEDHQLVVDAISQHLGEKVDSVLPFVQ